MAPPARWTPMDSPVKPANDAGWGRPRGGLGPSFDKLRTNLLVIGQNTRVRPELVEGRQRARTSPYPARWSAIQRSILASRMASGRAPSASSSSWKARMSKASPKAASARARSSRIFNWPTL